MKTSFVEKVVKPLMLLLFSLLMLGCSNNEQQSKVAGRWYTQTQVTEGETLYDTNCISCHGIKARGTVRDWKKPLEDGSYPPPPLNGSAHTWHHPKKALIHTINNGGLAIGGKMPGFKDKLNTQQIDSLLAYIQSLWSDDIYQSWKSRDN